MPRIELRNITKKFGNFVAVDNLSITIEDGDFITLLGPSGCGKTTTLRQIAGLEMPTSGEILIDGRTVFSAEKSIDVAPKDRGVGFLFQSYALWPHMTVYKNIAFGLENLKWPRDKIDARVRELLSLLKIEEFPDRYPSELSGGQQQRVAIARTLATNPRVLLMDEPLSNLDAKLRMEMRAELKRLHHETGATFVYVTHDQLEAMTLATKICLLNRGLLQQYEAPLSVYNRPRNVFVADFVGNPTMNLVEFDVEKTEADSVYLSRDGMKAVFTLAKDSGRLSTGDSAAGGPGASAHPAARQGDSEPQGTVGGASERGDLSRLSGRVTIGVRPENVEVLGVALPTEAEGGATSRAGKTSLRTRVDTSLPSGMETVLNLRTAGGVMLSVVMIGSVDFAAEEELEVGFKPGRVLLFDSDGTLAASGSLCFE